MCVNKTADGEIKNIHFCILCMNVKTCLTLLLISLMTFPTSQVLKPPSQTNVILDHYIENKTKINQIGIQLVSN